MAGEGGRDRVRGRDLKIGERVMCSGNGGYANTRSAIGSCPSVPVGMSFEQARCCRRPRHLGTMRLATAGRLKAGESVMIQGASSASG